MTACERALEAMSEQMDNALAAAEGAALRAHLASCAACRGRETGIGELRELLRRLEGVSARPPEVVALRVRAVLTGEAPPEESPLEPRRRSMLVPALAGAAIGILLAIPLAILVVRHGSRRPAPVAAAVPPAPVRTAPAPPRTLPRPAVVAKAPAPDEPPPDEVPPAPEPPVERPPDPDLPVTSDPAPPPAPPVQESPPTALPLPGALEGRTDIPQKFSGRVIFVTSNRKFLDDLKRAFDKFPGKVRFSGEDLPGNNRFQIAAWFSGPDSRELDDFCEKFDKFQEAYKGEFEAMDWSMDDN